MSNSGMNLLTQGAGERLMLAERRRDGLRERSGRARSDLDAPAPHSDANEERGASATPEEASRFLAKLRLAQRQEGESGFAGGGDEPGSQGDDGVRLLAEIAWSPPLQALFAAPQAENAKLPDAGALVEKTLRRIEDAFRRDLGSERGRPIRLALSLEGNPSAALKSLEISISPQALEVVLVRSSADVDAGLAAAAQALAARLNDRFPGRVIRILDRTARATAAGEGLNADAGLPGERHAP